MTTHPLCRRLTIAAALIVAGAAVLALLRSRRAGPNTSAAAAATRAAGMVVQWTDDAERIASGGDGGMIATPAIELFGLRGETLAFQVAVTANERSLDGVTVELKGLPAIHVERFIPYELPMKRRSGGRAPAVSLGWEEGARPPAPSTTVVDPLIPIALASHPKASTSPSWDYPMTVPSGRRRVIWLELFIPEDSSCGMHRGEITVTGPTGSASVPLTLEIGATSLPFAATKTMVFVEPATIAERVGHAAVPQALQLLHRHHLTPVLPLTEAEQLDASPMRELLSGELFTEAQGYRGPGEGIGVDLVVLGMYGSLGRPEPDRLAEVERILERLDELAPTADRFLYAVDEDCDSLLGPTWRRALAQGGHPLSRRLAVGHTCSDPPNTQDVDLVMMFAATYRPDLARTADKRVWIYNGVLPRTGSFLSDGWPLGLRANPWIQAHYGIERWFYWESVFWNDGNEGGLGPYDPFATAETFHNVDGDHANGDGVLLYPGRQRREGFLDLGAEQTLPSFRLAQWRRGIQDAGYLALAETIAPARARAIRSRMVAGTFDAERAPRFPVTPEPWRRARRELFELLR